MRSDGSEIPYPIAFDVYQIFKQISQEVHAIQSQESGQGKQSTVTLMGSRIQQESRMFPSKYQNDADRVFHALASLTLSKSNHDKSLITSNSFGDYLQLPGSGIQVPLGHFGEINTIYQALPKDSIIFNKTVNKIRWGGVADVFPRAVVICEDGDSFEADYVIITIPLGVLKALADTLFCPGLPSRKLNAVLKIPMGFSNKVFLEFTEPFWKWKKDFKKITYEPKNMLCKEGWLKGVTSMEPFRGSSHVICVTVAGLHAQCMEILPDQDIVCGVMSLLKESSPKKNIPEPVQVKRTSWSSDPNFYGSHSCMEPKVSSKDFYDLAAPLPEQSELCDPVLLFAGEATCPIQFGTVRGAKNSGIREAERLLQIIRLQNEQQQGQIQKIGCGF